MNGSMETLRISEDEAARDFAGLMARVRAGAEAVIESGSAAIDCSSLRLRCGPAEGEAFPTDCRFEDCNALDWLPLDLGAKEVPFHRLASRSMKPKSTIGTNASPENSTRRRSPGCFTPPSFGARAPDSTPTCSWCSSSQAISLAVW